MRLTYIGNDPNSCFKFGHKYELKAVGEDYEFKLPLSSTVMVSSITDFRDVVLVEFTGETSNVFGHGRKYEVIRFYDDMTDGITRLGIICNNGSEVLVEKDDPDFVFV